MTITERLNEIEEQTRELAQQAQSLEESKKAYEGLLECEVHDHHWKLEGVVSNLRHVQTIQINCQRCGCYAMYAIAMFQPILPDGIPVKTPTDIELRGLIPEEDE
tara:strand:- start:425 stop:739 length:315 start_codon:yes stop_codon:yes gene_type:complete